MEMPKRFMTEEFQILTIQKIILVTKRNAVVFLICVLILVLLILAIIIIFLISKLELRLVEGKGVMEGMVDQEALLVRLQSMAVQV